MKTFGGTAAPGCPCSVRLCRTFHLLRFDMIWSGFQLAVQVSLLISYLSASVVIRQLSEAIGGRHRPFKASCIASVMSALYVAQARAPSPSWQSLFVIGMYAVFFDRSGFSSLSVCLEHGIKCQITSRTPEHTHGVSPPALGKGFHLRDRWGWYLYHQNLFFACRRAAGPSKR